MLEWTLRGVAIAALAALLWSVTRPAPPAVPVSFAGENLAAALVRWTREAPADSVHLTLAPAPDAAQRDWLVALRKAGVGMSWRAPSVPAIAIAAEPVAEPRRRSRISVAAPAGASLVMRDEAGVLDSVTSNGPGASSIAATAGRAGVDLGTHSADAHAADSVVLKSVLVIGAASWESRFTIAALEEQGWRVEARLRIAPAAVVRQGDTGAADTARHAAVVALDGTAASEAASITRFVRSGGGLVLAGNAARVEALARIAPGRAGTRWQPTVRLATQPASLATLGYIPIRSLASNAVALETGEGGVAIAAHRVGSGRVVQVGYDETWRWRMTGGEDGPAAHAAWWGGLVSAAAYAPVATSASNAYAPAFGDAAPLASLAAAMGPARPTAFTGATSPVRRSGAEAALFALAIAGFLAEWASRRLRGAA